VRAALAVLAVAYPVLAHLAVARRSAGLAAAAIAVLLLIATVPGIVAPRRAAWIALAVGIALLAAVTATAQATLLLYLPPVAINAFLAWLFGHTLLGARVPLIERLVRVLHDEPALDPAIPPYARRLTLAWTLLFVVLGTIALVLALLAVPDGILLALGVAPPVAVPREVWSWTANVLNYVVVGVFFALEYLWRKRYFPRQPYASFADFVRRCAAAGPRVWRELRGSSAP
jgi:uncharacterized membrane protein